jgi:hypothetical protein
MCLLALPLELMAIAGAADEASTKSAAWKPQRLSVQGQGSAVWSMFPQVAVTPNGSAAVGWTARKGEGPNSDATAVVSIRRGPHGVWSSPLTLPEGHGQVIQTLVALADGRFAATTAKFNGDARNPNDAFYVSNSTGTSWRRVAALPGMRLNLVPRPNGSLLVIATDRRSHARSGVMPRGGDRVGNVRSMPRAAQVTNVSSTDFRRTYVNAHGDVLGVWPSKGALAVSVLRVAATAWEKPVVVAREASVDGFDVAVTPDDRFALAWTSDPADGRRNLHYSERRADGTWVEPQVVNPLSSAIKRNDMPRLTFGPEGPVMIYCHDDAAGFRSPRISQFTKGSWSAPLTSNVPGCIGGSVWFDIAKSGQHVVATSTPEWEGGWGLTAMSLRFDPFAVARTVPLSGRVSGWREQDVRSAALTSFGSQALVTWAASGKIGGGYVGRAGVATFDEAGGWQTRRLCNCYVSTINVAANAKSAVAAYERKDSKGASTEIWVAAS